MVVGEQPGNEEDLSGLPFVGPAGRLLEPRGKKRIHQKPNAGEVRACSPWLHAEIAAVRPRAILCMGATAAQALLGRGFKVTARRGEVVPTTLAPLAMATVHPSSILRAPDDQARHAEMARFVEDLRRLREEMDRPR
jgi:DNA polymerase